MAGEDRKEQLHLKIETIERMWSLQLGEIENICNAYRLESAIHLLSVRQCLHSQCCHEENNIRENCNL